LTTIHQRHRQDRQPSVQKHRANRFTNGRPARVTGLSCGVVCVILRFAVSVAYSEWMSSFLTVHQHILGYLMPYNGEKMLKMWTCNQGYLATINVKWEKGRFNNYRAPTCDRRTADRHTTTIIPALSSVARIKTDMYMQGWITLSIVLM